MKSGIYCIRSVSQNKIYIGQSVDLNRRILNHKYLLKKGKHSNEILQRHHDKYGINDLKFETIEFCEIENLDDRECYWINYYDSMNRKNGFNMETGGHEGKNISEERRQAITGEGNPMYGKKHSEEFINYMRIKNRASSDKLTMENVENIKIRIVNFEKQVELAKEFNVKISTINKIAKCKNWEWVRPELNKLLLNIEKAAKEKFRQEIIKYYESGHNAFKISKITNYSYSSINKILRNEIMAEKENWIAYKQTILNDYRKGLTYKEILEKHGVAKTTFARIISEEFNKRKEKQKEEIIFLKKSGMLNKNIAEILKIHRTTVTEYLKKYAPELLTNHANTEVNNQIAIG